MATAIGYVTCIECGGPLDPETFSCDCMDGFYEQQAIAEAEERDRKIQLAQGLTECPFCYNMVEDMRDHGSTCWAAGHESEEAVASVMEHYA